MAVMNTQQIGETAVKLFMVYRVTLLFGWMDRYLRLDPTEVLHRIIISYERYI